MCDYLKMRCRVPKMMKILVFFLIALSVGNGALLAQKNKTNTIKNIGKHLSELLINRGDINKSPITIHIERLFPDKDVSKFEDSPAMFILTMLYGAQQSLPQTWAELLLHADSLGVDKKAKYLTTYYIQRNKDNFILACILKQSSTYYVFNSTLLGWKDDKYVMRIYKKMKEYSTKKELKENLFSIVQEEHLEEMEKMKEDSIHSNGDFFKLGE